MSILKGRNFPKMNRSEMIQALFDYAKERGDASQGLVAKLVPAGKTYMQLTKAELVAVLMKLQMDEPPECFEIHNDGVEIRLIEGQERVKRERRQEIALAYYEVVYTKTYDREAVVGLVNQLVDLDGLDFATAERELDEISLNLDL